MNYITYENYNQPPHITIHRYGYCNQIVKNGGITPKSIGGYNHFDTFEEALNYAKTTGLRINICSFCKL